MSVSGGAGIAFGGGAFEGSYSNLLFITNRGVRYHSFIEGGVAGSFFGQSIGSPQQEGAVVPLGFFGGASVGPTLSNATRGTHIEGKFQTIEAAAGPGSVNIQASPSIWSITPAIGLGSGMGGYGNLTTNTMQLHDVNAAQVIINSVPQKP